MTKVSGKMSSENLDFSKTASAWSALQGSVYLPHNEEQYNRLDAWLDSLIDRKLRSRTRS
jgi:hypothetical protein